MESNITEYLRAYYGHSNRNSTRISWDESRYEPTSRWQIHYDNDEDEYWSATQRGNSRLFIDEWAKYFDSIKLNEPSQGFVSFVNTAEPKDLGEFSASGSSIQSLFEPCEVAHEE